MFHTQLLKVNDRNQVWWLLPHTAAYVWSLDERCETKSSALTKTTGDADSISSYQYAHSFVQINCLLI